MNPADPKQDRLHPDWTPVTYAKGQPEYIPLPVLRDMDGRVVSVWEPDNAEIETLLRMISAHMNGGPRPRVSLMLHTFGDPLQPIRLVVGDFPEPYEQPPAPVEDRTDEQTQKDGAR